MKLFQKKKSKKKDAKSGQADESAATPAKKSRKPYPRLRDANLPMQTTPFLFFLESIGGLGNRQSQIATPRHPQGNLLQPQGPCRDAGGPTAGWWLLQGGPDGGCPLTGTVTPPEETWWGILPQVSFSQHIHAGMSQCGSGVSWMSLVGWKVVVAISWFPKRDMPRISGTTQDMRVTQAQHLLPSLLPLLGLKGFNSRYPTQGAGEHQAWGQPPAAPRNGGQEGRNWADWDQPPVPRKLSGSKGNLHKE